jgi:ATP-dependent DNA helicase RecG
VVLSRRYRNRRVGEFLKELDLTEGRGTGIPKIFRSVQENGSPLPKLITEAIFYLNFTFILNLHH